MKATITFEGGAVEMALFLNKINLPKRQLEIEATPDEAAIVDENEIGDELKFITEITEIVCKHFLTSVEEVKSKTRERYVCEARFTAMRLVKELMPSLSLKRIGSYFGGRDHATVIHAVECHKDLCKSSWNFAKKFATIKNELAKEKLILEQ